MENLDKVPVSFVDQAGATDFNVESSDRNAELAGRMRFLQSSLTGMFHDLRDGDEFSGFKVEYSPAYRRMDWKYDGLSYRLRHDEREITSFEQRRPFSDSRRSGYESTMLVFASNGEVHKYIQDFDKRDCPLNYPEKHIPDEEDYNVFSGVIAEMRACNRKTFTGNEVHPSVAAQKASLIRRVMHRLITPVGE